MFLVLFTPARMINTVLLDSIDSSGNFGLWVIFLLIPYRYVLMICRLLMPLDYLRRKLSGDIWGVQDRR